MLQLPEHELHYHNATALMQDGNYQAAITEVNKAIKLNKNISDYYFLRAYALKHIGQYEQSILDYRFCIYLEPGAADTYNNLGQVYYDTNQYEEAIPWFQQALHINPTLPQALGNLGHIHSARGETRKALQHYYRSVLYNPDYLQAYADLGRFYRNNGRVHRSYHMMEYLLVQYPGYPSFRVERAICASTLHHMMAIDKEELAVAADDMEALYREETAEDAAYLAAELNFSTGNYGRALEYINFALKINPESPLYLNTRGMCYSETVEYNKALADFNTSLKINPALGDTWYNRAISNWRSGAIHEAARDFLKAREEGMSMFPAFRQTLLRFFEAGGLYYQHLVQELPNWATGILALNMQTLQRCDTTNRLLYLLHYETQNRQPEEITPLKQLEMATLFHQYHYPGCIQLYQQYFEAGNIENPAADFYYLYSLYMTRHNRYGEIQELLQQRYSHCTNTNCRGREAFYTAIIYLLCGNEKKAQGLLEQQENMPGVQLLYHMQHPVQPGTLPAGTIPVVYPVNLFSGDAIEPEQLFNLLPAYELMQLYPQHEHSFEPGTGFPELLQRGPIIAKASTLAKKEFFGNVTTGVGGTISEAPAEEKEDFYTSHTLRNCFNELEREENEHLRALTLSLFIKDAILPQEKIFRLIGFFYNNNSLDLHNAVCLYFYSLRYPGKNKNPVSETFVEKMIENNLKELLTGCGAYLVAKSVEIAVVAATAAKLYTTRLKKYLTNDATPLPYDEFCARLEEDLFAACETLGAERFHKYFPAVQRINAEMPSYLPATL